MRKKIIIDIGDIKMNKPKETVITIRIDEGLKERFQKYCDKEQQLGLSEVLRSVIEQLLDKYEGKKK